MLILLDNDCTMANSLIRNFGVEALPGYVIASEHNPNQPGQFEVASIADHPVTNGLHMVNTDYLAPLRLVADATALAWTPADTWTSESRAIEGPFVYMACANYGKGRVVVVSDDLCMYDGHYLTIVGNAIEWFLGDYWQAFLVDLNKDGLVNILDITIVATAYGSLAGSQNWNELADLDGNGVANIVDIASVAKGFGRIL